MAEVFPSFDAFADHLDACVDRVEPVRAQALETIGENTAERAREKMGVYQEGFGAFPGWAPLTKRTMLERVTRGFSANEPLKRSGELQQSITFGVDGDTVSVGSPLDKAIAMEFGDAYEGVPARPFVGPAMAEESKRNGLVLLRAIAKIFTGR